MIHILHGDNSELSYYRLNEITGQFQNFETARITARNHDEGDLLNLLYTKNLFFEKKIIVCENFLSSGRVKTSLLEDIPEGQIVIFFEEKQISENILARYKKISKIELYKLPSLLFEFLDCVVPGRENMVKVLEYFKMLPVSVTWHLLRRLQLLIVAKRNFPLERASELINKRIEDWQWKKILNQADKFEPERLVGVYQGLLKVDFMIKSGSSSLSEQALISALFVKYLFIK